MSVGAMWRSNAVTLFLLILLNLAAMSFGLAAWIALGVAALLGAGWLSWRQGLAAGHDACGVTENLRTITAGGGFGDTKQDRQYAARAWSRASGVKAMLLSALIPYGMGCLHIVCALLNAEPLVLPTRILAWILALPWWCTIVHWQPTFDHLTGLSAAVLMITPFLLPLCQLAGYLQGPKLWARTEQAMADGRRRARARSRVGRRRAPREKKPEL